MFLVACAQNCFCEVCSRNLSFCLLNQKLEGEFKHCLTGCGCRVRGSVSGASLGRQVSVYLETSRNNKKDDLWEASNLNILHSGTFVLSFFTCVFHTSYQGFDATAGCTDSWIRIIKTKADRSQVRAM